MWIQRDLLHNLGRSDLLETVLLQGSRQVGKSSLLEHHLASPKKIAQLDDLSVRSRAQTDPALFFEQYPPPMIIDEFQYAPQLLPEIKSRIDEVRRLRRKAEPSAIGENVMFFLSGSNQIEIDKAIKESLAGRVSIFTLHGLSVGEILKHSPDVSLSQLMWRGGFPELYVRPTLSARDYLNDYVSTYIEKDIARSVGISKLEEFLTVVRLLAARVGSILNRDSLANDAGVAPKTVSEWVDVLVRTHIAYLLPVYSSNLNSRLTKAPKIYFLDTGLATRLQGHIAEESLLGAPQAGALFENLVVAEVIKARDNNRIPCDLSFWRTKEKEELDLVISYGQRRIFLEVKLAIQGVTSYTVPTSVRREFGDDTQVVLVTAGGEATPLSKSVRRVPLNALSTFLRQEMTSALT